MINFFFAAGFQWTQKSLHEGQHGLVPIFSGGFLQRNIVFIDEQNDGFPKMQGKPSRHFGEKR